METFFSRKKRRRSQTPENGVSVDGAVEDTDLKLAILQSLFPLYDQAHLLEVLLSCEGSVEKANARLNRSISPSKPLSRSPADAALLQQSSLASFVVKPQQSAEDPISPSKKQKSLTRKGQTLYLFSPQDIAEHTPCSIIHNFLPAEEANALLKELLDEAESFQTITFKLFDNIVTSPHTSSFYVDDSYEAEIQKTDYLYNGARLEDIRLLLPEMRKVKSKVQSTVNEEIRKRIETHHGGKKLRYQDPGEWLPNAAFVNCYDGGVQSVGYHSDQLTYLGPRAIIGSLSLGVAREFRVRKIVARDEVDDDGQEKTKLDKKRADAEGQISIHLPHNSLLVMHAEMQEEWKHSIHPAPVITPHPIAGNKRINITYRHYKEPFHPKYTPKCKCKVPTVLRCVQRKSDNRGKYFWMCHAGNVPEKTGCDYFLWASFDEDGNPPWASRKV